ncbi:MAG: hypothetical protein PHZ14_12325, partial [Sulfuricella sp.]|nr:hypothetical protein [Sulfuricella sp.]
LGETLAATGIFDTAFLREMVDQHQSGLRDYSASLWTILMFEAFLRKVVHVPLPSRGTAVPGETRSA